MTTTAPSSPANTRKRYFATIAIEEIDSFPYNYRKDFEAASLEELARSIEAQGIIEPIIVHHPPANHVVAKHYFGICGERRFRAAQLAGLKELPCVVHDGITEAEALELALVENLQRKDVNPMEEAAGYAMLRDRAGLKQTEIASRVGRPRSTVANALRLLDLPENVQALIAQGQLTKAHGVALLRFRGYEKVIEAIVDGVLAQETPAGNLENGVPFLGALNSRGLALVWQSWSLHWKPDCVEAELRKCRDEDSGKGWFRTSDQGYVCLNVDRAEEIEERLDRVQEEYEKQQEEEEEADGDEDCPDYKETPEQREGREKREAEVLQREEAYQKNCARAATYFENFDKKGPTGASEIREWDGVIKAMLLAADMDDWICDLDQEVLNGMLPPDQQVDDDTAADEVAARVFKRPAHHIVEALVRDRIKWLTDGHSGYRSPTLGRILDLLEGKEVDFG